ncbi:hypothetical protein FHT72_005955 [Rhizobium sp. BK077]|uniref:hypothetical protein n=1 Tax=unclassified Rhizobium TaxID=2613769 RepID=UPI0016227E32|nr:MULTISPECIES: hypothetical protein [unclassified Rhizobium]MBB3302306.1 hypothetical protein [Rhizobium sp. BK112]MBB3371428.1 hypothetical protein [Rhizobium sp. BK077]MBB4182083.1 hypothetical protein [Rhizobium sp. BK109]
MFDLGEIDGFERQLKAAIVALNKKKVASVALVEAVDDVGLWPDAFESLFPIAASLDLDELIKRAPLFICAVAVEIGFRFEGVGTVFWAKLSDALGLPITMAQRQRIGDAFKAEALRYDLSRPTDSAFTMHFSIIAWPIANALLPIDLVGPVSRLIARAPVAALPGQGRSVNFPTLRAWAGAAEGARLSDWLRFEAPTARVLTALLTENRGLTVPQRSYTRLRDAMAVDPETFFAARAARLRARAAKPAMSGDSTFGRLSLSRDAAGLRLFASWPPLPQALYDDARSIARSAGWRPRLWGAGNFLHPDNALSGGPFAISTSTVPSSEDPAYPEASEIFGAGSDIALALAGRSIDWGANLLFDVDDEQKSAEQHFGTLRGNTGLVWVGAKADGGSHLGLKTIGTTAGYHFFEADLADADVRSILTREGLFSSQSRADLARHPSDAIFAPQGVVRADRPFLFYRQGEVAEAVPQSLPAKGWISAVSGEAGRPAVRTEASPPMESDVLDVVLFERDSAFEALIEQRLQLRVESRLPLVDVKISVDLEIDGRLIARGRDIVPFLPLTLPATSKILGTLYADKVRTALLETGRGLLRIQIGRTQIIDIKLARPAAAVVWDNETPRLVGAQTETSLVEASAQAPHRFSTASSVSVPGRGVKAYGLLFSDGRIADPVRLFMSDVFDYGDVAANFGDDIGSRRMFDRGRGVCDIARARVAWARALCTTLPAIGAKGSIVRQFEEPLVIDLCGRAWSLAEQASRRSPTDPHEALWLSLLDCGLALVPSQATAQQVAIFAEAFVKHARDLDPDWPIGSMVPRDGAMDDALNLAFSEAITVLHSAGALLDVEDDFDFGAPPEDWEKAANTALRTIRRTALARQIAPSEGGRALSRRNYANLSISELAEDLAAWTKNFALPRGQLSPEVAAGALQLWLSPAACDDVDTAIRILANDPFVSRATRYAALRVGPTLATGIP